MNANERATIYYEKNKDEINRKRRDDRKNNPEKYIEENKKNRDALKNMSEKDKEARKIYMLGYYEKNEKFKSKIKEFI